MSHKNWKQEICTIPNALSLFRLVLIPVYLNLYHHARRDSDYLLAGSILALSCLTDLVDGKIAREFHMVSNVGKILDPLADKLTQFFLLLSMAARYTFLYPMIGLFVIKELFQLGTMVIFARNGKALPGALATGKICTAVLFVSLTLLVLFPRLNKTVVIVLIFLDTALLLYSFHSYFLAYFGRNTKLTDLEAD